MTTATPAPIARQLIQPSLAEFRQSYTLPGEAYTSPELFAWELRNFFEPSWGAPTGSCVQTAGGRSGSARSRSC